MPLYFIVVIVLLAVRTAEADIYRYVDEEGVECFTDAPTTSRAAVVMKDPASRRSQPKAAARKPSPPKEAVQRPPATPLAAESTETAHRFALPAEGFISSWVGMRRDPIDGTMRQHEGIDIAIPMGTPVRAAAPGVVIYSGARPRYGNTVIIEHSDGMLSLYAHNSANLSTRGDRVDEKTIIALSGSTGRSTGPHLHFEAWKDGMNVTESLIGPWGGRSYATARSPLLSHDGIRREVQVDGTLRFTNLP